GSESPQRAAAIRRDFGRPVMKALGLSGAGDVLAAQAYHGAVDRLLFDAKPPKDEAGLPGGNGLSFDWTLLGALDRRLPFMLSGGLDPDNVGEAIALTRPDGVDVSSGVERSPGVKDARRIADFVRRA